MSLPSVSIPHYTCNRGSSSIAFIVIVLSIRGSFGQDSTFPDEDVPSEFSQFPLEFATANDGIAPTGVSPEMECGVDELLKKSHDGEKYCECVPGYLRDERMQRCHEVHKRGPCKNGSLFVFEAKDMIAKCVSNPCKTEQEILYRGACHGLGSQGPCDTNETLMISAITLQPTCESDLRYEIADVPLIYEIISCAPGTRRVGDMCRKIL